MIEQLNLYYADMANFFLLSQVFMKRGVLHYLEQQREQQVTGWLVHLQAACLGHLARQKYRRLKVRMTG